MFFNRCLSFSIIFFIVFTSTCCALKIEISRGNIEPDPIAIVEFFEKDGNNSDMGSKISKIIKNDLDMCGLFIPIDKDLFLESPEDLAKNGHNIKNWHVLKARFLLYGKINQTFSSRFEIDYKLIDVVTGEIMLESQVSGNEPKLRKVAHVIADQVYERITNERGYFNTHIIYAESSSKAGVRRKTRLVKIDQDGENVEEITDGSELTLMARYSTDGKNIAFISYRDNVKKGDILGKSAHVYVMNLENRKQRLLINKPLMLELIKKNNNKPIQMTYAPRFSSDGAMAVLGIIIDGKSAIYILDIEKNELKPLTKHTCIDTSPCFSPDDSKIVFTSNRQGQEALYIMDKDGKNQQRISKEGGKYSQPVWSPRGDLIAFAKSLRGKFYIGLMKPDGTGERLVSGDYLVEAPCWASNGRYISYSMEAGPSARSNIAVVDMTGNHIRIIETRKDATYPAWSPTLAITTVK
ncbi:MAG: Tol-Pal system protein TolB [Holosporales bacterium]|jgi:TolB protein|nr:Tol-Pal system protein TolB [Holosporales bacterium]